MVNFRQTFLRGSCCQWAIQHSEALKPLYRESLGISEHLPKLEAKFFLGYFLDGGVIHAITLTKKKKIGENEAMKSVFGGPASSGLHIDVYSQATSWNLQTVVSYHQLGHGICGND